MSWLTVATSSHFKQIRYAMKLAKQATPEVITEPDEKTRLLRARLILEEAIETIRDGLGVSMTVGEHDLNMFAVKFDADREVNMTEIIDGCGDLSVVTIGTLVAVGMPDMPLLQLIDENNLQKLENAIIDDDGKYQKPPGHKPPDVAGLIDYIKNEERGYRLTVNANTLAEYRARKEQA